MGRMPAVMAAETGVVVRGRMARMKRMKADHVKSRDAVDSGASKRMRCAGPVVLLDERWSAARAFSDCGWSVFSAWLRFVGGMGMAGTSDGR